MGSVTLEYENQQPLSLEGRLSREDVPSTRQESQGDVIDSRLSWRPVSSNTPSRKDVNTGVSEGEIYEAQLVKFLTERISSGDTDAKFELGQFYFEKRDFDQARTLFEEIESDDLQAQYQLAVMYYDGLGINADHRKAVNIMESITRCKDKKWDHIVPCAQYHLGRAYYEGFGVQQSDAEAENLWILAARDGNRDGSIKAQTTLGMFYSRPGEETYDIRKAHFWHQEATGNGSLESQVALGILYLHGLGVNQDTRSSFQCLKSAAEKGSVYAIGQMAFFYYRLKLFNNAVDFAQRVIWITDPGRVADETGFLVHYVKKGIALCCFIYGRCLYKGFGVKRNKDKAVQYYSKAAENDIEIADHLQDLMIKGYI